MTALPLTFAPVHQLAAQVVLAEDDKGRGSPIGLFVVIVLCVAVYFLWRSLNRHIKRVPESFDAPPAGSGGPGIDGSGVRSGTDTVEQRPSETTGPGV